MAETKKVANGLVALSSAAVLAIYGAGYARTQAAAERFAQKDAERRPRVPTPRADRESLTSIVAAPAATAPAAEQPGASSPPAVAAPATADSAPAATIPPDGPRTVASATPAATVPAGPATPAPQSVTAKAPAQPAAAAASAAAAVIPEAAAPADDDPVPAQASTAPATPPPPVVQSDPATATAGLKDGTYYGWGTCRHGDIQAAVVIESGRITEARVQQCLTRYSCNWVTPIFPRIVAKQGTTYDYVSGATESSDAFQDAVAEALAQAK